MRDIFAVILATFCALFFSFAVLYIISFVLGFIYAPDLKNIGVGGLAFLALIYPFVIAWVIYSVVFSRILVAYRNRSKNFNLKAWIRDLVISMLIETGSVIFTYLYALGKI